jgi:glycine/D-amino acid oxidase-like deaminating enzyme
VKLSPFWTDDFPRPADLAVSPLPSQVDVVIVGGGYTGLSAARVLAQNGARVAVLEQNNIGWGASSRNGGMATTGLKESVQNMIARYGEKMGKQFWSWSLDSIDLVGEIIAEENIDCCFLRPGHVKLAAKPSHFEKMKKQAQWFKEELNHTFRLIGPEELHQEIGSKAFYGGIVDELSGALHPARYVFGLATAVTRYGGLLCENTAVTNIHKTSNSFEISTSQGTVQAQELLLATNGYTDGLVPDVKRRVFPGGSYIIVTEPLAPEVQARLSPKGRMFYDSKWFLNYFRLTPDGRMLFGGRNNLSPDLDLETSARRLWQRLVEVFPELEDAPITHSWSGQLGLTFDLMPHIGRVDGVHYALGYCGHGLSIATLLGAEVGLLLAGKKTSSPFLEIPHNTQFFYRERPWFLPLAAYYYRALDWLS